MALSDSVPHLNHGLSRPPLCGTSYVLKCLPLPRGALCSMRAAAFDFIVFYKERKLRAFLLNFPDFGRPCCCLTFYEKLSLWLFNALSCANAYISFRHAL